MLCSVKDVSGPSLITVLTVLLRYTLYRRLHCYSLQKYVREIHHSVYSHGTKPLQTHSCIRDTKVGRRQQCTKRESLNVPCLQADQARMNQNFNTEYKT